MEYTHESIMELAENIANGESAESQCGGSCFPKIVNASKYKETEPMEDPNLIENLLQVNSKMQIAGSSKTAKTFFAMRLAFCLAIGELFFGYKCIKGSVLYVNLELKESTFFKRLKAICNAMNVSPFHENFNILHLRGVQFTIETLIDEILNAAKGKNYTAIIIDPLYKTYNTAKIRNFNENASADMGYLYSCFDRLMYDLKTAVIIVHHFSKGSQSGKSSIDRGAGSGVSGRDFDALLTLTELDGGDSIKNAFRIEFTLREFKSPEPINVQWEYPIHRVNVQLAGLQIKGSKQTPENVEKIKNNKVIKAMGFENLRAKDLQKIIETELGVKERAAKERIRILKNQGYIVQNETDETYKLSDTSNKEIWG